MMRIPVKRWHQRRVLTATFACLVCLAGLEAGAVALIGGDPAATFPSHATAQLRQQGGVSLQQAIEIATRRHGGRVVSARTVTRNGRTVHEIRLHAEDGRVRTVRIDAETGEPD